MLAPQRHRGISRVTSRLLERSGGLDPHVGPLGQSRRSRHLGSPLLAIAAPSWRQQRGLILKRKRLRQLGSQDKGVGHENTRAPRRSHVSRFRCHSASSSCSRAVELTRKRRGASGRYRSWAKWVLACGQELVTSGCDARSQLRHRSITRFVEQVSTAVISPEDVARFTRWWPRRRTSDPSFAPPPPIQPPAALYGQAAAATGTRGHRGEPEVTPGDDRGPNLRAPPTQRWELGGQGKKAFLGSPSV
jgi:hypothetical protein